MSKDWTKNQARGIYSSMPLFTRENAAEMARRSKIARDMRKLQANNPPEFMPQQARDEHENVLREQIEMIDRDIKRVKKPEVRCKLIAAKAKLWTLLYPEPANGKARGRDRAPVAPIAPLPVAPVLPIVAPQNEQEHKSQSPQSQVAA